MEDCAAVLVDYTIGESMSVKVLFKLLTLVLLLTSCATSPLENISASIDKDDAPSVKEELSHYEKGQISIDALMIRAVAGNRIRVTKLLIKEGADLNLSYTSYLDFCKSTTMADLLIKGGINVNKRDKYGFTPIMKGSKLKVLSTDSSRNDFSNDITLYDYLRKHGADTSLTNNGKSTLDWAKSSMDWVFLEMKFASAELEKMQEEQRQREAEQRRKERAESREFWKGAATLATGVAVGKATSGYAPDQQTRMMKSSMNAVDSGDTSELTETTNQVKAEQAQSHKTKMQAIEAQKERDRAVKLQNNRANQASTSSANSSKNGGNTQVASNQNGGGIGGSPTTEDWKPAFKSKTTLTDCTNRAREMGGNCLQQDIFKPAFTAADSSAAEQSKLCSEIKNRALNGDFYNIVEDFGCGCWLSEGRLMCTYFTIGKSRHSSGGGGKEK